MVLPISTPGAIALAAIGAVLAAVGARRLRPEVARLRAAPVAVYEAPNVRGPVELRGTARPHEDTLEAPFTGRECVAYRFGVEEYESAGKHSYWKELAEDGLYAPFRLEDDSGSILVEPGGVRPSGVLESEANEGSRGERRESLGARPGSGGERSESAGDDFVFDREWSTEVGRDETVQGRGREFLERVGVEPGEAGEFSIGPIDVGTGDRRRYTEARLEVGDPVAVYGPVAYDAEAGRGGGTGSVNAAVRAADDESLVVAAGDRVPTLRRSTAISGGLVVAGLAMVVAGLATALPALRVLG